MRVCTRMHLCEKQSGLPSKQIEEMQTQKASILKQRGSRFMYFDCNLRVCNSGEGFLVMKHEAFNLSTLKVLVHSASGF